jgi:hypothetical protein
MRLSQSGYGPLLVVALAFAVIGAACGDPNVGRRTDDPATSVTTGAPTTSAPITVVSSPDGLDCENEARMMGHGDPASEFAGFASPEEAVLAAASTFHVSGTPKHLEGDTWVIVSDAGLTVARTDVGPWQEGWIAGDVLACDLNEMSNGSSTAPPAEVLAKETLIEFLDHLRMPEYAAAAALYGGSYETLIGWNPEIDPQDHAALLENGCTINGLQCLYPTSVTLQTSSSDTYQFLVEFEQDDGSLLTAGPCCGSDASTPPQTEFTYTVVANGDGGYLVQELPPYLP